LLLAFTCTSRTRIKTFKEISMLVSDLYGVGDEFIVQGIGLPTAIPGSGVPADNQDLFGFGQEMIPDTSMEGDDGYMYGLGEEMDYSQGLPTPMGGFDQQPPTPEEVARIAGNAALMVGLVTGAVQGGIAYLLISNAKKWQAGWAAVGYIAGGLFALGAAGSLTFGLLGKTIGEGISRAVPKS
jgi:hypothetical protein